MATYKNIRIKMKGGKSRMQRVMVFASGKYKFVKNITKSRVKKTKTSKKSGGNRKMGKRKFTIPIAPIAGILAAPAVQAGVKAALDGDWDGIMYEAGKFIGFKDGQFDAFALGSNVGPIILGILIHKFVGGPPLNVNRMLASANVPIIRI